LGLAIAGCATAVTGTRSSFHTAPRGPRTAPPSLFPVRVDYDRQIAARFETVRAEHQDLGYADLLRELDVARAPDARPSFDPTGVDYYKDIRKSLGLTAEEQEIFKRNGIVGVDHDWRYSMAGAYLEIYRHDLPVLVTADSILHAMHRSFDAILMGLEVHIFAPTIQQALAGTRERLLVEGKDAVKDPVLRRSLEDVDLYVTVARNLGEGSLKDQGCVSPDSDEDLCPDNPAADTDDTELLVKSDFGQDTKVREVLRAIVTARSDAKVSLYGRPVTPEPYIDWTQFKPRGHYTKSPALSRFFRMMMWLGRVDVGFKLAAGPLEFGKGDADRELRDAALLAWTVRNARQVEPLAGVDRAVGFLVGLSDNLTVADMIAAMERAGVRRVSDLSKRDLLAQLREELGKGGGGQRIRSQLAYRTPGNGPEVPLPDVFQLFGQRFVIDSFVTSKVVFDSIVYKGEQQQRPMPTGLDVMAALGNDEALGLAQPEIAKWNYGANLLAARRVVEERPPAAWDASQYDLWLSALSKLDDVPAGTDFPEVMRSQAWSRKQLQTQLGSWAELRHDTILYAKQSYTMGILCEYPTGYVEPYPEFYARVALFAETAAERLSELKNTEGMRSFLGGFAKVVRKLEGLARKELTGQPFADGEKEFVKAVIRKERQGGGCGPPTIVYTGWYKDLLYSGEPDVWEPTIADVHTGDGGVLEEAVGDVNFLVAAIDSRGDRAAYVGPIYSYYEFTSSQRLTDEQWRARIKNGKLPPRPDWVGAFQGKPEHRSLVKK
jgi:Protein of unknown function (DUF3160)